MCGSEFTTKAATLKGGFSIKSIQTFANDIGVGPCRAACGDMLEATARIAPWQPNEAMARIAPSINGTISLDPSCRVEIPEKGSLDVDLKLFSKVQIDSKRGLGKSGSSRLPVRH